MRAAALLAALVLVGVAGAADLYRWTDKDGKVHFGDAPPPDAVAVQKLAIKSAPTDPARIETQDQARALSEERRAMEDKLRTEQAQRAEQEKAAKQAACDAARQRHAALANSRKFATTGADGKERWMSGADADKMKAELKAAADKACEGL